MESLVEYLNSIFPFDTFWHHILVVLIQKHLYWNLCCLIFCQALPSSLSIFVHNTRKKDVRSPFKTQVWLFYSNTSSSFCWCFFCQLLNLEMDMSVSNISAHMQPFSSINTGPRAIGTRRHTNIYDPIALYWFTRFEYNCWMFPIRHQRSVLCCVKRCYRVWLCTTRHTGQSPCWKHGRTIWLNPPVRYHTQRAIFCMT